MQKKYWDKSREKHKLSPALLIILVLFLLFFCCILVWGITPLSAEGPIPAPIHASTQANYGAEDALLIPNIDKSIIQDVILDQNPYAAANIVERMATLGAHLQIPIPTMTLSVKNQLTATAVSLLETPSSPVETPTLLPSPLPSSSPSPLPSATTPATATAIIFIPSPTSIPLPSATAPPPTATPVPLHPALTLVKSGSPLTYANLGDTITYTYLLENSGNVTLSNPFTITDDKIGTIACGTGTLVPGATTSCIAIYTVTQDDLDSGSVTNIATGHTTYDGSSLVSKEDTVKATIQNASYTISKSVTDVGGGGATGHANEAGDILSYQIVLTNVGNVDLSNVTTSDPLLGGVLTNPVESEITDSILNIGETFTYTGTYTLQQSDLDNNGGGDGDIDNTASTTTNLLPTPQTSSVAVPVTQIPELTLIKSANPAVYDTVGDVITYTFDISNTGNITISGPITVSDDRTSNETCPALNTIGNLDSDLDVGESLTCSATYSIVQADLDAGYVTNIASASGKDPNNNTVTSETDTITVNAIISIFISDVPLRSEKFKNFHFDVNLSTASNATITVQFATVEDSATGGDSCETAGVDFLYSSGVITFSPTTIKQKIIIKVCRDEIPEDNEIFYVVLSNPINATISDDTGMGTIEDDD